MTPDTFRAQFARPTTVIADKTLVQELAHTRKRASGLDTAHLPTVSDSRALVLYLLPEGAIEFTHAA